MAIIRIAAIAGMIAMLAAAPAQAEELKPYAGVGLGSFSLAGGTAGGLSYGTANAGGFVLFGGVKYGFVGGELRLMSTGDFKWSGSVYGLPATMTTSASGVGAFLRVQHAFDNIEVYGLLGRTSADVKVTLNVTGLGTFTGTGASGSASYGIGANYSLDNFGLGLEWMQYYSDLSALSLNLVLDF
ncbi:MAG: outer membrane beta-barrel protein [Mariprofundaceae bacterium]